MQTFRLVLDPDFAAVLLTVFLAIAFGVPGIATASRRRRDLRRFCASCGRRVVLGERTCDCER